MSDYMSCPPIIYVTTLAPFVAILYTSLLMLLYWDILYQELRLNFTLISYNHMALMSLRNRSHVKASMLLKRDDQFLYTII